MRWKPDLSCQRGPVYHRVGTDIGGCNAIRAVSARRMERAQIRSSVVNRIRSHFQCRTVVDAGQLTSIESGEARTRLKDLEELLNTGLVYSMAPGMAGVRHAIGQSEGVAADDVRVVTGAQEGLLAIFCAIAEPGANVVVPHPGYPPFSELPRALGLDLRHYHLRFENRFRIEPSEIMQLADRETKLVLINAPHNPAGAILSIAERTQPHDYCAEREIQFVCNQVFHPIYHCEPEPTAATRPAATVVGDLSKALSLSGLRIGWIVEHDAARRANYEKLRSYFTVTNSPLCERL